MIGDEFVEIMSDKRVIDPSKLSDQAGATRDMALKQTAAARNMFAKPSAKLKQQLGTAAIKMSGTYDNLPPEMQEALGARLLGAQGLLAGAGADIENEEDRKAAKRKALGDVLKRVATDGGAESQAKGSDRSVFIALMGDIGALFTDTGATTGTSREAEDSEELRRQLAASLGGGASLNSVKRNFARIKEIGGSEAVGPHKKQERVRPTNEEMQPRTGIHNVGPEVDEQDGIAAEDQLGSSKWDKARISVDRVRETPEPLAGHMSGSPSEILQVWDMLAGVPAEDQFTLMEDQRADAERAASRLQRQKAAQETNREFHARREKQTADLAKSCAESAKYYEGESADCAERAQAAQKKYEATKAEYLLDSVRRWTDMAKDYAQQAKDYQKKAQHWQARATEVWGKDAQADEDNAERTFEDLKKAREAFEKENPERDDRLARAAGAAGFLVGQGFHSALEVAEGVLRYDGQDLRTVLGDEHTHKDAGDLFFDGAATDIIADLLGGQTQA